MKRNLFLSVLFVLMFAPAHAQQVNILSYNVHNCIGMDKEYNYRRIANVISQTSPDIVALQELDSVTVRNKGIHALGELEKLTGMHGTYAFCATHQSLTPEDQLLAVPLIEKALQNVDKPIFMAGDMNSAPASVPQLELAKHFATLNDTTSYTFPADRPNRCIDYIYGYSKNGYRFDVQYRKVIEDTISSDHRPVQVIVQVKGK